MRVESTEFENVTEDEWKIISSRFGVRVFDFFFKRKYPDELDNRVKFLKALEESATPDVDRHQMWDWWQTTRIHKLNMQKLATAQGIQ